MKWVDQLWQWLTNLVPVERWVGSVSNLLRYLTLAFILLFVLIFLLIIAPWGFSPFQRAVLIVIFAGLLLIALLIGMFLAIRRGDLLYSPYDRSLRRGVNYGTSVYPQTKRELEKMPPPADTSVPQLPTGSDRWYY